MSSDAGTVRFDTYPLVFGAKADPGEVREAARVAERAGFSGLRFSDHVVLPKDIPDEYPFTESGEYPYDHTAHIYEVFDLLSFLAGVTAESRLLTNICVVPFRHPVTLAKNALTVDSLSGGRFELGVGLGWLRTEFEVLDVPFQERASRTDEFLEMFELVCEEPALSFDGPHHSFQETGFYPRPVSESGPPIWVGGNSRGAFKRLARFGDGWLAPGHLSTGALREAVSRIAKEWDDQDRSGSPEIGSSISLYDAGDLRNPAVLAREVEELVDAGVTVLNLTFSATEHATHLDEMQTVGDELIDEFA